MLIGDIPCTEKRESFRVDGETITRIYQVEWNKAAELFQFLQGVPAGASNPLAMWLPHETQYGQQTYRCRRCSLEGQGKISETQSEESCGPAYTQALIAATYELWTPETLGAPRADIAVNSETEDEVCVIDSSGAVFFGTTIPVPYGLALTIPITTYKFTRWVSYALWQEFNNKIIPDVAGHVNSDALSSSGGCITCRAEEALVGGLPARQMYKYQTFGYEIDIAIKVKKTSAGADGISWNKIWRGDTTPPGWFKATPLLHKTITFTSGSPRSFQDFYSLNDKALHEKNG